MANRVNYILPQNYAIIQMGNQKVSKQTALARKRYQIKRLVKKIKITRK